MVARTALLVAGGTGGHLFPALAAGAALERRGWQVHYGADGRTFGFLADVPAERRHLIRSATLSGGNPVRLAAGSAVLARGLFEALGLVGRIAPDVAVGFGGYPTLPPLVAARLRGVPILVHEANIVLGRANRLLLRLGADLATSFPSLEATGGRTTTYTGNPLRPAVIEAAKTPYRPAAEGEPFELLVFGGSQGAKALAELVPAALARMDDEARRRVRLTMQCRPEDLDATRAKLEAMAVAFACQPFFEDLPQRIAAAHLVLSRAGASTVFELAAIGRPAILVPYPHALDHDQAANARALADAGGAWIIEQPGLDPDRLARELTERMNDPERLRAAALASRQQGRPDAADRLADLVETVAKEKTIETAA